MLRREAFVDIGAIIQDAAGIIIERWCRRAIEEQPDAKRCHHAVVRDGLPGLLRDLGRSLAASQNGDDCLHREQAAAHGEHRWQTGWSLSEVVADYQILRLVLLEYLDEELDRPISLREHMAIGLSLDEAVASSVEMYTAFREEATRQTAREKAELQQRSEAVLREKAQMLEEADRRKDYFLATLAHELRNPLSPIQNAIDLMRRSDDSASLAKAIDITERQVGQLVRLVDDLLDVARISQGKVELRKQLVRLEDVVNAAVEATRPTVAARSHELRMRLPKAPVFLEVDPARLQQVLCNLINNAAKYTDPGGEVVVEGISEKSQAIISVRDNGIGIAPSLLPRIFELFTQSDASARRSQGGLGIGLTLVRSLVELHGGTVAVQSDGVGQGSKFIVRLPVAQTMAEKKTMSRDPVAADGQVKGRILLVDDNKDVVSMLAVLLRRVGHDVMTAHDGQEAIDVASRETPQFILLDIGLPGMDGYEVAKQLRTTPQLKDACLIAMTGYGQDEDLRRAEDAGFHHHLLKPVRLESIQAALDAWHKKATDGKA